MNKYVVLIICFTLFISCQKTKKNNLNSDDFDKVLTSVSIELGDSLMYVKYPYKIRQIDSLLFVWDLHAKEDFIHVFSFPEVKYKLSIGHIGDGPNEILRMSNFDVDEHDVYIFDIHKVKLLKYAISNIKKGVSTPSDVINYPREYAPLMTFANTGSGFVLFNPSDEKMITFIDENGKAIKKTLKKPINKDGPDINPLYLSSLWNSNIDYDIQSGIVATVTSLGDVLYVYNVNNDTEKFVFGEGGLPTVIRRGNAMSIGKIDGFCDVRIVGNHIYTIFSGADRGELGKLWDKGISTPNGGNQIIIYDLNGNIKKRYKLDRYITGFDITSNENQIIAVDTNSDEQLCFFNLK